MNIRRLLITSVLMLFSVVANAQDTEYWSAENLHQDKECLLQVVRNYMGSKKNSPAPQLKLESDTSFNEFQDAMEKWTGFRPDVFLNVYDGDTKTIYLKNIKSAYIHPRTPVASLVHELAHFVQMADQGYTKQDDGDWLEQQAVQVQWWFIDNRGQHVVDEKYQGPCE